MNIKVSDLKRGTFFCTDTINPNCTSYGLLRITSVKIYHSRFNTSCDGWCSKPSDYIDRDRITINYKNANGKASGIDLWLDELTNPNISFPNFVFFTTKDAEEAKKMWERFDALRTFKRAIKEVNQVCSDAYPTLKTATTTLGDEKYLKIKDILEELASAIKTSLA